MNLLLIDRDGTIIIEPKDTRQVNGLAQMVFLPNTISALKKLQGAGWEIVVVSNQDWLGTPKNPLENYEEINAKIREILASEGVEIKDWLTCPHALEQNCQCRKPKIGLMQGYMGKFCKEKSVMIGDRDTDVEFAQNLGIRGLKITENYGWNEIVAEILQRKAEVSRKTFETDVKIALNLDGSGKSSIDTGLKFLDHMLTQIAKHGNFDLEIKCKGDLEIDEHHTIEDIAISLGQAYKNALGNKRGITRFASNRLSEEQFSDAHNQAQTFQKIMDSKAHQLDNNAEITFNLQEGLEDSGKVLNDIANSKKNAGCINSLEMENNVQISQGNFTKSTSGVDLSKMENCHTLSENFDENKATCAVERFAPLDEAISYIALDISARPFCKFECKFQREYCGDVPTEMIPHFFQSFATSAEVSLHIKISGENTHHKIESCFKTFAKVLMDASKIVGSGVVSSKGVL